MEANKAPLEKSAWYLAYVGFPAALLGKQGRSLPGRCRNLRYFGDLKKRGINPKLKVFQAKTDGKSLAWLLSLEVLLNVQSGDSLWKVRAKQI